MTHSNTIKLENPEFSACVTHIHPNQLGESALLFWTDGINEWRETYERLSTALMRAALLQRCAEVDDGGFFTTQDPADVLTLYQILIKLGVEGNHEVKTNGPAAIQVIAEAVLQIVGVDRACARRGVTATVEDYKIAVKGGF